MPASCAIVRTGTGLPLGLLLLLLAAPSVSAHAYLDASTTAPGPNAHVDLSPPVVHLVFTENVERRYTHAWVLDNQSRPVYTGNQSFPAPNALDVPILPLRDGLYTVQWWALSVDTHTASGSYLFAVGNVTLEGCTSGCGPIAVHVHGGTGLLPAWAEPVANALLFAGVALSVGLPFFVLKVDVPSIRRTHLGRLGVLGMAAGTLGALGAVARLQTLAATIPATLPSAVLSTKTGPPLAAEAVGLALAALAFWRAYDRMGQATGDSGSAPRAPWTIAMASGAISLLGTSFASHAAALTSDRSLAVLADAVHLGAASLWIGGVAGFVLTLQGRAVGETSDLVRRFSPWAMWSVAFLVATGVYAGFRHLNAWQELWQSAYGFDILLKALLALALIALGAWNQRRTGPQLASGKDLRKALRGSLAAEAALMAVVLAVTGLLTASAPPDAAAAQATQGPVPQLDVGLRTVHIVAFVQPQPVVQGALRFTVDVHPLRTAANGANVSVLLQFQAPGAPPSNDPVAMARTSDTEWSLPRELARKGAWTVTVVVQTPEESAQPSFVLEVA